MVRTPPKIHTAKTMAGDPTAFTISEGTRKIALPMTVPMTTAIVAQGPRARRSSRFCTCGFLLYQKRQRQTGRKRGRGPDHHIPGKGDGRGESNVQHEC